MAINSPDEVSLRRAALTDLPVLRAWCLDAASRGRPVRLPSDPTEFAVEALGGIRYVVEKGGLPVASFSFLQKGPAVAEVDWLVPKEHDGGGFLGKVLVLAQEAALAHGFRVLSASVFADSGSEVGDFVGAGFRTCLWFEKNLG